MHSREDVEMRRSERRERSRNSRDAVPERRPSVRRRREVEESEEEQ